MTARKTHHQKVAAKEDRKVLRRRILRVLSEDRTCVIGGRLTLRDETVWRVAALVRELDVTK